MNENLNAVATNNHSSKNLGKKQCFGIGMAVGSVVTLVTGLAIQGARHLGKKKAKHRRNREEQAFEEANALIDQLTEQDLYLTSQIHKSLLRLDRLYLQALAGERPVPEKRDLKILKAYRALLCVCRTNYALALADGDRSKAEAARSDFEKLASDYPYSGDLASEQALLALAEARICAAK